MFKLNSKLTMACSAAVLALAMAACSSSSDDDPPVASNVPEVVEPSGPTNDQVAASQTALNAYSSAQTEHAMAKAAYDADMSVDNAAAVQMAATALQAAATAAHTAIEAGASDAQKEAFGDTAVADAAAAVMSAADAVTLANAVVEAVALANAIAASQTALNAYSSAQTAHTAAKAAYDADMSVDNATALQMEATALQAAATAAETAIAAGASDAQKAAFGDTAEADATAAVMSAGDAVTLANAIVTSQGALDAYSVTQTAHTAAKAAYDADTSVANATALQMEATALHVAAMAAHAAIAAGSTDAQKEALGDTAVAEAAQAVADAATFVIAARIVADEGAEALKDVQSGVMEAMTAAGDASVAAQTAATAAQEARANRATMQTGDLHAENSGVLADKAQEHADAAAAAAKAADDANVMAMAATDAIAATRELVMAEAARDTAEKQQMYAETARDNAATAAMAELMIVDTVKTVGGTSLDATAGSSEVITDGDTERTGLLAEGDQPIHMALKSVAVPGVNAEPDANPTAIEYTAPVAAAAAREFPIGKLVDSADDTARLMIVTQYAGSKTVKVYAAGGVDDNTGTKAGYLTINDGDDTTGAGEGGADLNNVPLKSEGTYYLAGTDDALDEDNDIVADDAEPVEVFSYVDPNASTNQNEETTYLVWLGEDKTGTGTVYRYTQVVIHVAHDADGDATTTEDNIQEVTAKIPEATDYKHIHFGVWAALGAPEKNGNQDLSDLGIGFVQNFSGGGLTSIGGGSDDMPNGGGATYNGDWVAAVQSRDGDGDGDITLQYGAADLVANFDKATIDVNLMGLGHARR